MQGSLFKLLHEFIIVFFWRGREEEYKYKDTHIDKMRSKIKFRGFFDIK